jgi:hypothetical protein
MAFRFRALRPIKARACMGMAAKENQDMSLLLIAKLAQANYGLSPSRWLAQLVAIRKLPEAA